MESCICVYMKDLYYTRLDNNFCIYLHVHTIHIRMLYKVQDTKLMYNLYQ